MFKNLFGFVLLALLVALLFAGCDKANPVGPSPTPEPPPSNDIVLNFPVPGSDKPMLITIFDMKPEVGGKLIEYPYLSHRCTGPKGWDVWFAFVFLYEGKPDPDSSFLPPGTDYPLDGDCDLIQSTQTPWEDGTPRMTPIRAIRYMAWFRKHEIGNPHFFPECLANGWKPGCARLPDVVRDVQLNWRAP